MQHGMGTSTAFCLITHACVCLDVDVLAETKLQMSTCPELSHRPESLNVRHTHCNVSSSRGMQVLPGGMVVLAEPNPDSLLAALEEAVHLAHTVDPHLQHQQVKESLHC